MIDNDLGIEIDLPNLPTKSRQFMQDKAHLRSEIIYAFGNIPVVKYCLTIRPPHQLRFANFRN